MAINPLGGPIDYSSMLGQQGGVLGGQGNSGLGNRFMLLAEQKREQLEQEQFAADLNAAMQAPTVDAFSRLGAKYHSKQPAISAAWEMMGAARQDEEFTTGSKIFQAIGRGRPDVAKRILQEKLEAAKAGGQPTEKIKTMLDGLDRDPKEVMGTIGAVLATADPKRWKTIQEINQAAELQPHKMSEAQSKSGLAEIELKFAPKKLGLELNLSEAQIKRANASRIAQEAAARKSGAEADRAAATARQIAEGIIPADKRPEAEEKFRKEYSDQTKVHKETKSAYGRVLASSDDAVGDLSLIFGYMKMLDPASVVREGEFANAQNAAGVPDRIQNVYNRLINGERLSADQRRMFKAQAGELYNVSVKQEKEVRGGIERIAKSYGLAPDKIFYTKEESAPVASNDNKANQQPTVIRVTTPDGKTLSFPNQQAADAFKTAAGIK